TLTIRPRTDARRAVRVTFPNRQPDATAAPGVQALEVLGSGAVDRVELDAPLLTALMTGAREKRRHEPLAAIPTVLRQAVLAIEDQSFYVHPGINPVRLVAAAIRNLSDEQSAPV